MIIDIFLQCISGAYLCAFISLYVQIPGLYGNTGILPVRTVVLQEPASLSDFQQSPTVLRYLHLIGLDAETGLDLCSLIGVAVAFGSLVWKFLRNSVSYFILWILYLSIFHVGQTFLWFQWDILLLEVGFLTVLIAPFSWLPVSRCKWFHQHDSITLWLVKWLLFRLMFSSGVVKLTSGCPTWWGLTALNYHYETQCIPTPLAWYAHQLPEWFQRLSVVLTFLIEIIIPFMFFLPSKRYVSFAALAQIFLMVLIILTGNYNFFNWLTIAMCLPLLMESNLFSRLQTKSGERRPKSAVHNNESRLVQRLFDIVVYGSLVYVVICYFSVSINWKRLSIDSKTAFIQSDLEQFLDAAVPLSIWVGIISLSLEICFALVRCLVSESSKLCKLTNITGCVLFGVIAAMVFFISLVPYSVVHQPTRDSLPSTVKRWHSSVNQFQLTSSYGLFRQMTGVGGRPEVIIQGSNSMRADDWFEYEFLYKPGDVSRSLPLVAPHQPRLDWQMWFAALGSYHHNPWLLNVVYRLLTNEKRVIELIAANPFPNNPPLYIRASLYHYHFTKFGEGCTNEDADAGPANNGTWWCRKFVREYIPIVSMTEPSFVDYLKRAGILENPSADVASNSLDNTLARSIKSIRDIVGQADGFQSCISLLSAASVLLLVNHKLFK